MLGRRVLLNYYRDSRLGVKVSLVYMSILCSSLDCLCAVRKPLREGRCERNAVGGLYEKNAVGEPL